MTSLGGRFELAERNKVLKVKVFLLTSLGFNQLKEIRSLKSGVVGDIIGF
jgi:hypothetical protein